MNWAYCLNGNLKRPRNLSEFEPFSEEFLDFIPKGC